MNWLQRKIYLYNVTFGLYMLDWWERYLFNTLIVVLMWFIFYNGSQYVTGLYKRELHNIFMCFFLYLAAVCSIILVHNHQYKGIFGEVHRKLTTLETLLCIAFVVTTYLLYLPGKPVDPV